jgi:hypothetical protein
MAVAGSSMNTPETSTLQVNGSPLSTPLYKLLMADNIEPGSDPSYQLCKIIYLYHPLGAKMAEAPIKAAQSQARKFTVQNAPPEVLKALADEHRALKTDENVKNLITVKRVYGIGSIAMGSEYEATDEPVNYWNLWRDSTLYFNVLDPLNTAGSLVLNQNPNSPDFEKPTFLRSNGKNYHRSRYQIAMNESPVYIAYTSSAFGYVGRSVYQRALFPLKSFIRSMIADDMIELKLGLIVAKMKSPGSVINKAMQALQGLKRAILKEGQTGNVISIGIEEEIATLDMQNVDGAGTFARSNILKNAATASDMPAVMLENETLTEGFGEGTEDAKNIARYINTTRQDADPIYSWFDNIAQYRAWNPEFFAIIQRQYPVEYGGRDYKEVFFEWKAAFTSEWPSWLIEPESDEVKVEKEKCDTIVAVLEKLLPQLDPSNKNRVLQWAADNLNESKRLFPHELVLDYEALEDFQEEEQQRLVDNEAKQLEAMQNGAFGPGAGGDEDGEDGAGTKQISNDKGGQKALPNPNKPKLVAGGKQ